jgi:hypothetical protein
MIKPRIGLLAQIARGIFFRVEFPGVQGNINRNKFAVVVDGNRPIRKPPTSIAALERLWHWFSNFQFHSENPQHRFYHARPT